MAALNGCPAMDLNDLRSQVVDYDDVTNSFTVVYYVGQPPSTSDVRLAATHVVEMNMSRMPTRDSVFERARLDMPDTNVCMEQPPGIVGVFNPTHSGAAQMEDQDKDDGMRVIGKALTEFGVPDTKLSRADVPKKGNGCVISTAGSSQLAATCDLSAHAEEKGTSGRFRVRGTGWTEPEAPEVPDTKLSDAINSKKWAKINVPDTKLSHATVSKKLAKTDVPDTRLSHAIVSKKLAKSDVPDTKLSYATDAKKGAKLEVPDTKLSHVVCPKKGSACVKSKSLAKPDVLDVPDTILNKTTSVQDWSPLPQSSPEDAQVRVAAASFQNGAQAKTVVSGIPIEKGARKKRTSCLMSALNIEAKAYNWVAHVGENGGSDFVRAKAQAWTKFDVPATKLTNHTDAKSDVQDIDMKETTSVQKWNALPKPSLDDTVICGVATSVQDGGQAKAGVSNLPIDKGARKKNRCGLMSALNIEDPVMYLHRMHKAGALHCESDMKFTVDSPKMPTGAPLPPPQEAVPVPSFKRAESQRSKAEPFC